MAKSTDAFRTIGEVSDELDVPKHVLRFWEGKFPQLKPMKRGGGRRFYRPEDVTLLRGIHHLLHSAGYTIKGVQRILREQGVDAVKAALAGHTAGPAKAETTTAPVEAVRPKRAVKGNGARQMAPDVREHLMELSRQLDALLEYARGATPSPGEAPARAASGKAKRA